MFDNIGRKIKRMAGIVFLVGLLASGICMIGMWITGVGLGDHAGGFTIFVVGLLIGMLFCRDLNGYWEVILEGLGSKAAMTAVMLWLQE